MLRYKKVDKFNYEEPIFKRRCQVCEELFDTKHNFAKECKKCWKLTKEEKIKIKSQILEEENKLNF